MNSTKMSKRLFSSHAYFLVNFSVIFPGFYYNQRWLHNEYHVQVRPGRPSLFVKLDVQKSDTGWPVSSV